MLKDVERLNSLNFKEGNIIFEIVLVKPDELTLAHIVQLYDIELAKAELAEQLHDEAKQLGLSALEINPSYGGECIILFRELGILPGHVLSQQSPQSQT